MSVYIDPLFPCVPNSQWRWKESCHMWADTESELHAFAKIIGLRREWFQVDATLPHYDLTAKRRAAAIANGAVQVSRKDLATLIRKRRGL